MLLLPNLVAGYSGVYVEALVNAGFCTATACLGLPVLALVWLASRMHPIGKESPSLHATGVDS